MQRCVLCAHRAKRGAESPLGRLCDTCILRVATLAQLGGDVAHSCWGIPFEPDARTALSLLIERELEVLDGDPTRPERRVAAAEASFREGHAQLALLSAASALVLNLTGPVAERALALMLGPMLKPAGEAALRGALFRT